MTRNIAIGVSYDGTPYCGWQVQPNGVTVAEMINGAIVSLTGKRSKLYGSGRTDSGVHACAQVANFHTEFSAPAEKVVPGLNAFLPPDIRVLRAYEVDDDFNARFCAVSKTYEYVIQNSRVLSPFLVHRAYLVKYPLDTALMNEAASVLTGVHDFTSFMASGSYVTDAVRDLSRLEVRREGDIITITASANGFLYNMVRILAGTLIYAGCGRLSCDDVKAILEKKDRSDGAPTVPPDGLYLKNVVYQGEYSYVV